MHKLEFSKIACLDSIWVSGARYAIELMQLSQLTKRICVKIIIFQKLTFWKIFILGPKS